LVEVHLAHGAGEARRGLTIKSQMLRNAWFRHALARTLTLGPLLIAGPVVALATALEPGSHALYDFRDCLYLAGVAILHGRGFYEPGFLSHQAAIAAAGHLALGQTNTNAFSIPVYPAFANLLIAPISLIPYWAAAVIYELLAIAAMIGGLRLLGVTDRRCFALALLSWPFLWGMYLGAIGPFLMLGVGIAWHWRDRTLPPAIAVATVVAVKVFPWTLGVWLLITRRYRALAACVVIGAVVTVGAWAAIGFQDMTRYPQMLSDLSLLEAGRGISVVSVMMMMGVPYAAAAAAGMAMCGALLVLAWRLASGPDGDRRAFGLVVIVALATSPVVWEHYMVLLFVPVALASPGLSRLWLAPLASPLLVQASRAFVSDSRVAQANSPNGLRQALSWLLLEAIVGVWLCTTPERRGAWLTVLRRAPLMPRPHVGRG
jgi:hypothetical protein